MPTTTFTLFHDFAEQAWKGVHDFSTDTFKIALTNSSPDKASNDNISDITQISATGGYTSGGYSLDGVSLTRSSNVAKVTIDDEVIAASGGDIGRPGARPERIISMRRGYLSLREYAIASRRAAPLPNS